MHRFGKQKYSSITNLVFISNTFFRLATIFMVIVLMFLICHFPRILLSLHEMTIIRKALVSQMLTSFLGRRDKTGAWSTCCFLSFFDSYR